MSLAAPKPAVVPGPAQWTIDTQFTHPQQIVIRYTPDNQPIVFWYTIITLTNKTGNDVGFYPKCDLMTDTFQIIPEGKDVIPAIFKQIKARHQNRYPFLEFLDEADNKLIQGEDNTKDIAIIWPDFDEKAKNITLFITGLSNETAAVDHPVTKDENGQAKKVFLRKTLELKYAVKGNPASRDGVNLEFKGKRWIMR
ncbi:MAG: hypothetical protein A2173_02145 [Planctomycetes bacterium RBG_13_44_8b]|nr:MAG: hypothetical protein A2173_02145 [Planctomycetes bacterium RBG_13_44_8b]